MFLPPVVYSCDEFTEHVNTLPFTVLSTDESVRTLEFDEAPFQELTSVHDNVCCARFDTVQFIIVVLPTVRFW